MADVNDVQADDVAMLLAYAKQVVIVPGYGLAVAQAQHKLRELCDNLESRGVNVKYVVHPVAGRMPGHMNVLLAEANVPYNQLYEPEDVNPDIENVDACLVVGANDVVNPAARDEPASDLYGMPIIEVDRAKHCRGHEAEPEPGFRRPRQRVVLSPEHDDAVRRRGRLHRTNPGGIEAVVGGAGRLSPSAEGGVLRSKLWERDADSRVAAPSKPRSSRGIP